MGTVGVFHHIGEPTDSDDHYHHTVEQILGFDGQITFDGVYHSVWDNWSKINNWKKLKAEPLLFVSGDQIGRPGFLNREQLECIKSFGFTIGWHGWSHRKVTELDEKELIRELSKPSWVDPIYAYPHGEFDQKAINMLKEMNYKQAYSTTQGEEGNPYAIPRIYL